MSDEKKQDEPKAVAAVTMNVSVGVGEDGQPKIEMQKPEMNFLGVRCVYDDEAKSFKGQSRRGAWVEVRIADSHSVVASVSGKGFGYSANQPTQAMAEEDLKSQLLELHGLLSFLTIEMAAPTSVANLVERFVVGWGALPPLVRAGFANGLIDHFKQRMRQQRRDEEWLKRYTILSRRARVDQLFGRAALVWLDLAIGLTGEADSEAEANGIDEDIRYRGSPLLAPPPLADVAKAVREDASKEIAESLAREIDKETMEVYDRTLGVEEKKNAFSDELRTLLNKHSMEGGSDTPDYALAQFMTDSLDAFEAAVVVREKHAGRR